MRHPASNRSEHPAGHSAFAVALCLLCIMALTQLVVAGMALAVRFKEAPAAQIIEREVIREVRVEVPVPVAPRQGPKNSHSGHSALQTGSIVSPPTDLLVETQSPKLQPSPLQEPPIEEPKTAALLKEAREARVAGDMVKAIVKLEQALIHSPGEPGVVFELAVVHEEMGLFDQAAIHYEEVFRMGMPRAGALYPLAAAKLSEGISQPVDMLGKLSLGRVQVFKDPNHESGQQVTLTIPVQKAPDGHYDKDSILVKVQFFIRTDRGEVVEFQDSSWVQSHWISGPWDWAGGSEQLRMVYTIPKRDLATDHLFGVRNYYGQVVTLSYKGEVLDVQAWPRDLAARIAQPLPDGFGELPVPDFQDTLPPDFDPNVPLLPTLRE